MIYKQATISCYVDKLKSIRGFTLLTVNQVKEIVGALKDPIIDVPLKESEGIVDVSIKDNINHVSVKVAMAQLGGNHN